MSENNHAKKAAELVVGANTGGAFLDPDTMALMSAQAEATLALAYEQRTANLLAYLAWVDDHNANVSIDAYGKVADQVTERLGL